MTGHIFAGPEAHPPYVTPHTGGIMPDEQPTPRTEDALKECIKQGGIYEPFHGPLIVCSKELERELSQCRADLAAANARATGWENISNAQRDELEKECTAREALSAQVGAMRGALGLCAANIDYRDPNTVALELKRRSFAARQALAKSTSKKEMR